MAEPASLRRAGPARPSAQPGSHAGLLPRRERRQESARRAARHAACLLRSRCGGEGRRTPPVRLHRAEALAAAAPGRTRSRATPSRVPGVPELARRTRRRRADAHLPGRVHEQPRLDVRAHAPADRRGSWQRIA